MSGSSGDASPGGRSGFTQGAAQLALQIGVAAAVLGMSAVTAGVVLRGFFLPGVIVLAAGLLVIVAGATAGVAARSRA